MQRTSELAKITELNLSDGIKYVKVSSTEVTAEALVAAFFKDAQTTANCKPYGKPDFSLLPKELKPTLALAQSEKTANTPSHSQAGTTQGLRTHALHHWWTAVRARRCGARHRVLSPP